MRPKRQANGRYFKKKAKRSKEIVFEDDNNSLTNKVHAKEHQFNEFQLIFLKIKIKKTAIFVQSRREGYEYNSNWTFTNNMIGLNVFTVSTQ